MTTREELIEAGALASAKAWGDPAPDKLDYLVATAVLNAVEPLIRADEARRWYRLAFDATTADLAQIERAEALEAELSVLRDQVRHDA